MLLPIYNCNARSSLSRALPLTCSLMCEAGRARDTARRSNPGTPRALLEFILSRAQSRYHHHGVRHPRKLEALSGKLDAWRTVMTHVAYVKELRRVHARKMSFWSRYNEERGGLHAGVTSGPDTPGHWGILVGSLAMTPP